MQASSSQGRPYQGYPYVNPHVVDAPSIDATTAARWANLPRRKVTIPTTPGQSSSVVYVDIPGDVQPTRDQNQEQSSSSHVALPAKVDTDDTPVVYIDMPEEASGSEVVESRDNQTEETTYVEETIFYDPFDNKRINVEPKEGTLDIISPESDLESLSEVNTPVRTQPGPSRPARPNFLNLAGSSVSAPSTASPIQSVSSTTSTLHTGLTSDGYIFNRLDDSLTGPITSGFPEPPPAYTEIDIGSPQPVVVEQPRPQPTTVSPPPPPPPPPRTQVIVQGAPSNLDRKYLTCHHCGMRVHTLVVKEIGPLTHLVGLSCLLICMLPVVCLVYYLDCLKNKNHYCPNCNKIIGYELPLNREKVVYIEN